MARTKPRVVYVVGAGLSAGLGFPTIGNLLTRMWPRLIAAGLADDLAEVVRFHHPDFNPLLPATFINVEQLLSEMKANEQLFESSRPATGRFTAVELEERRRRFLLEIAEWFHELQANALTSPPTWLLSLVDRINRERVQIISFNWDLVLDELLFGKELSPSSYGMARRRSRVRLLKPHGSLNWYAEEPGRHLKATKRFKLAGKSPDRVFAFKRFRAPASSSRSYMPLIVPPILNKEFDGDLFKNLWQETVSVLSKASEVRFLGFSMAEADFHARFILRCGFHNQEHGELDSKGGRRPATGRAKVTVVDLDPAVGPRIQGAVGWPCHSFSGTIEDWISSSP
jgi:hypothetical protein